MSEKTKHIANLTTEVFPGKDILEIFLLEKTLYKEIVHSERYTINSHIVDFFNEYKSIDEPDYRKRRKKCISNFNGYIKKIQEMESEEESVRRVEELKNYRWTWDGQVRNIHQLTDKIIEEMSVDIMDVYLIDHELYTKIVTSNMFNIDDDIIEFLGNYKVRQTIYKRKRNVCIAEFGNLREKRRQIEETNYLRSLANGKKKRVIKRLTDKICTELPYDILDIFLTKRKIYDMYVGSTSIQIDKNIIDFFETYKEPAKQKQPKGKKKSQKESYQKAFSWFVSTRMFNQNIELLKSAYMHEEKIEIRTISDRIVLAIPIEILDLFIQESMLFRRIIQAPNCYIDDVLLYFLNHYTPEAKNFIEKKKEYQDAFESQFALYEEKYNLIKNTIAQTQKGNLRWVRRHPMRHGEVLTERFEAQLNSDTYLFTINSRKDALTKKIKATIEFKINDKSLSVVGLHNQIYNAILKSLRVERNKLKNEETMKEIRKVCVERKDFVVRTNIFRCISEEHHLEEVLGIINVVQANGNVVEETVTAAYCKECKCYFLMRSEYERVVKKGILMCHMIERDEFMKYGLKYSHLAGESILMRNGYNVKATVGLTDIQRQTILANIMDNHILTASQIISFLQMFMAQKNGLLSYKNAVDKWDADLQFVRLYREDSKRKVFISSITKTAYRKL